jgi:hypothetical protein
MLFTDGRDRVIILPAELSAAAVLISYWTDINGAAWIALLMVIIISVISLNSSNQPLRSSSLRSIFWVRKLYVLADTGGILRLTLPI